MSIRCVAFDLDDTFWDCKTVINHAEQQLYHWISECHPIITEQYSLNELVGTRAAYMRDRPELHHDLGQLRILWMHALADEFKLPSDWIEPAFEHFLNARNQVEFFPGVAEALNQLSRQFKLGVITNGNAEIHRVGLGHLFDFAHSSAAAGVAKPEPLIFEQALEMAKVKPHEMVYIGDDPEKDIIGANRAGLRTIWFNPSQREWGEGVNPDAIMTNFDEIVKIVQSL
ncbi:MAG: HAD family hydrolase [Thiolinea sp.]